MFLLIRRNSAYTWTACPVASSAHLVSDGCEIGSVALIRIATVVQTVIERDHVPRWELEVRCPNKVLGTESTVRRAVRTATASVVWSVLCVRGAIQCSCNERNVTVAHRVANYENLRDQRPQVRPNLATTSRVTSRVALRFYQRLEHARARRGCVHTYVR